ncbi:MAG: phosphotransferase [Planctomycetota bacterium]|nr:phosphotransferase [Planctomycetota bacterium]
MTDHAPWMKPEWRPKMEASLDAALESAGRPRTGPIHRVRGWGRSCTQTVPTESGTLWIKHHYGLPPGEEVLLAELSKRWADRLPGVVTTLPGAVIMEALPGVELTEEHPVETWEAVARSLAELQAGESSKADFWLESGARDRRPTAWRTSVEALMESPVVTSMESELREGLMGFLPDFIGRYEDGFQLPPTLVHQDSGCCNIHVAQDGPIFFDWSDVVVGHAMFSCDRLLDQPPEEYREAIIQAYLDPLGLTRTEFQAMRRSNVLHEVLRYHDELTYLSPEDVTHKNLSRSVQSQLTVLVNHERAQRRKS